MKKFILLFIAGTLLSGLLFNSCDNGEDFKIPEYVIGKTYGGGTIILLDDSQEHGVIASRLENITDSVTWEQAKVILKTLIHEGYSDWRLPTKEEADKIWDKRDMVVGFTAEVNGYCWTSVVKEDSILIKNLTPGSGGDSIYTLGDSLHNLRVVRDF